MASATIAEGTSFCSCYRLNSTTTNEQDFLKKITSGDESWVPTLMRTEASLSYAQCFFYHVSSSINVSFLYYMSGYFLDRSHMLKDIEKAFNKIQHLLMLKILIQL